MDSLCSLTTVITALNSLCEIVTSITLFELRLQMNWRVFKKIRSLLLSLTRTLCSVLLIPAMNESVVWCACTQKELTNQHASSQFPWSERGYYLFKTVMVRNTFSGY